MPSFSYLTQLDEKFLFHLFSVLTVEYNQVSDDLLLLLIKINQNHFFSYFLDISQKRQIKYSPNIEALDDEAVKITNYSALCKFLIYH